MKNRLIACYATDNGRRRPPQLTELISKESRVEFPLSVDANDTGAAADAPDDFSLELTLT